MLKIESENLQELIKAYLFGELTEEDETQLDNYLDEHSIAAEMVNELMQYCQTYNINSRQELELHLSNEQKRIGPKIKAAIQNAEDKKMEQAKITRRYWLIAIIILLLGSLSFLIWKLTSVPKYSPALYAFWEEEYPKLVNASPNQLEWETAFIDQDFEKALLELEKLVNNPNNQAQQLKFYICVLYALIDPPNQISALAYFDDLRGSIYEKSAREQLKLVGINPD